MSVIQRIAKNTLFMWTSNIISKGLGFVLIMYLTRKLSVANFGRYSLVGIIIFYFNFFSNLGIGPLSVREISRHRENASYLFNNILTLRAILGFVSLGLLHVFARVIGYEPELVALLTVASIAMIINIVSNCFDSIFISFEKMQYPALFGAIGISLIVLFSITVLEMGFSLRELFMVSVVISFLVMVSYANIVARKILRFRPAFQWQVWKSVLIQALPFGILMVLGLLHSKIDIFMLSKIEGPVDGMKAIGYYSAPHKVFLAIMLLIESMRTAIFPMISANFRENIGLVIRAYYIAFRGILYFLSIPLLIFFIYLARPFLTLVFSSQYGESTFAMQILALAYALMAFNTPIIMVLMNIRNLYTFVPVVLLAGVLNISLNWVLIPRYSYNGAAVATLVTVGAIFVIKLIFIWRTFDGRFPIPKLSYRLIPLCACVFGFIHILKDFNLTIAVIAGISIYYIFLFVAGIIDREDREKLKQLNPIRGLTGMPKKK